jgi:ATP-dependent DNA helicase RecQ
VQTATLDAAQQVLHDVFGYPTFRPGQAEVIEAILEGRDCIAVMPTGAASR